MNVLTVQSAKRMQRAAVRKNPRQTSDTPSREGYLPSQLFNLDGSKYGSQAALETLLEKCHKHGIRCLADIVINHRLLGILRSSSTPEDS